MSSRSFKYIDYRTKLTLTLQLSPSIQFNSILSVVISKHRFCFYGLCIIESTHICHSWLRRIKIILEMGLISFITGYLAPMFIIISPITSYADQTYSIHRNKSSAGFSLDIPLIMLVASFLRCVELQWVLESWR